MGKNITKIIYKPDTQSTDEFIIIVNPDEVCHTLRFTGANLNHLVPVQYKKYKAGGEISPQPRMVCLTDRSADT